MKLNRRLKIERKIIHETARELNVHWEIIALILWNERLINYTIYKALINYEYSK